MGHSSIARCSCGFVSDELFCASNMRDFQTVCNAAVICNVCGHIGTINLLEDGELAPWVLSMWNRVGRRKGRNENRGFASLPILRIYEYRRGSGADGAKWADAASCRMVRRR